MTLKKDLIKLAHKNPELRDDLLPLVLGEQIHKTARVPYGDNSALLETLRDQSTEFIEHIHHLLGISEKLQKLIDIGELKRFQRSSKVEVLQIHYAGMEIKSKVQGSDQVYDTKIDVSSSSWNCNCPDREKRGEWVGPCKHTMATGRKFWYDILTPEVKRVENQMKDLLKDKNF